MGNLISTLKAVGSARLHLKYPFALSWSLTGKCNSRCVYCAGNTQRQDMDTGQIMSILDSVSRAGVKYVSFTGGEPLLRDDFAAIMKYSREKGIFNKLNTNGLLLADKIDELECVDLLHLSLDGQEDAHDAARGEGSFRQVVEGLEAARKRKITTMLSAVISKYNVHRLEEVLEICRKYGIGAFFQPSRKNVYGSDAANPAAAEPRDYREAISMLMLLKKRQGHRCVVLNSLAGLRHLYHWPAPEKMPCYSGITSFKIDSSGFLFNCTGYSEQGVDLLRHGFKKAMGMLRYRSCNECWCATQIEFNLAMNLNVDAVRNYLIPKMRAMLTAPE